MKIRYQCDRCGSCFDDAASAQACERCHVESFRFKDAVYQKESPFPSSFIAVADDGKMAMYWKDDINF